MAAPGAAVLNILTAGGNRPPSPFTQMLEMADDPGAPDFVGALGSDQARNQDDLQNQNVGPTGQGGSGGALGNAKSRYNDIADQLLNYGGGPLAQANALKDARARAAAQKRQALGTARQRIQDLDKLMPDPRQSWALGIGAPTRTGRFSEAISNAYAMRQNALDERRKQAMQNAQALSNLDLAEAGVDWDLAQAEGMDQDRRLRLAEQFNQQARIEAQQAQDADIRRQYYQDTIAERAATREAREAETAENRRSREEIARENREARADAADRVTYQPGPGPDPKDPSKQVQGMWELPTRRGEAPVFHAEGTINRGGARGAATSVFEQKRQAYYDLFKKRGFADDQAQQKALEMASGRAPMSPSERRKFAMEQALKESEKEFYTPEERQARTNQIENELRQVEEMQPPKPEKKLPFSPSPSGQGSLSPMRRSTQQSAAPARAASPTQATRQPMRVPASSIPPRPRNIPAGSAYSARLRMWRDPMGTLYDEEGMQVTGSP